MRSPFGGRGASLLCALLLTACGGGGSGDGAVVATPTPVTVIVPSLTPQYTVAPVQTLVYGQGEVDGGGTFVDLLVDLYVPEESTVAEDKRFPLLVMLHGGFFEYGSKSDAEVVQSAQAYASRGWLVAAINYRLQDDDPVPSTQVQPLVDAIGGGSATLLERTVVAGIDDVITALDFLQARDDVYVPWTTVWGFSAGAYLALLSGYALDDFGVEPVEVAAVIDYAGSLDGRFTPPTPFDAPAGGDPVLQIIHGTADTVVPYTAAETLESLAQTAGLPYDFQPVAGAGHVIDLFATLSSTGATLYQRTVDYHFETLFAGQDSGPLVIN